MMISVVAFKDPLHTHQNMTKNASLKIGWPGGQNVRTLRESRVHPLSRSHLPSGAKIRFLADDLNNYLFPTDSRYIPLKECPY